MASPREFKFLFDYGRGGWDLKAISRLDEVGRLSTGELHAWRECGEISEAQLRALLDIDDGRRYLAAAFPEYGISIPEHLRDILEKLIKSVDPREPYSDQGLAAAYKAEELTQEQYEAFKKIDPLDRLVMSAQGESYTNAFRETLRLAARRLFLERNDPHVREP